MKKQIKKGASSAALIGMFAVLLVLGVGAFLMKDTIFNLFAPDELAILKAFQNTLPSSEDNLSLNIKEILKGSYNVHAVAVFEEEEESFDISLSVDRKKEQMFFDSKIFQLNPISVFITNSEGAAAIDKSVYKFEGTTFGKDYIDFMQRENEVIDIIDIYRIGENFQLTYDEIIKNIDKQKDLEKNAVELINKTEFTSEKVKYDFDGKEVDAEKMILNFKAQDLNDFLKSMMGEEVFEEYFYYYEVDIDIVATAYIYKNQIIKLELGIADFNSPTVTFVSNDLSTTDWVIEIPNEYADTKIIVKNNSSDKKIIDYVMTVSVSYDTAEYEDEITLKLYADSTKNTDNFSFEVDSEYDKFTVKGDLVANKNAVSLNINKSELIPFTMKFGIETLEGDIKTLSATENLFDKTSEELMNDLYSETFLEGAKIRTFETNHRIMISAVMMYVAETGGDYPTTKDDISEYIYGDLNGEPAGATYELVDGVIISKLNNDITLTYEIETGESTRTPNAE